MKQTAALITCGWSSLDRRVFELPVEDETPPAQEVHK